MKTKTKNNHLTLTFGKRDGIILLYTKEVTVERNEKMSVYEFKIGDIVKFKKFDEVYDYFIVTDVIDFTKKGATTPDIECEVGQIMPITRHSEFFNPNQNELQIVARVGTKENAIMIDFVIKERAVRGFDGELPFMHHSSSTETSSKKIPSKDKFNKDKMEAMIKSNAGENKIEEYIEYMDKCLELLHQAIIDGDKEDIELQKSQLKKVRQELMELEYFSLTE